MRPAGSVTFTREIAPLLFHRCAPCHRPGQAAPFSLLSYASVRQHARQIAEVTRTRSMPPWLAEPGFGDFANSRRLDDDELGLLQQWIAEGCIEGRAADLPSLPRWNDDWTLGRPDLVLTLPQSYALASEGRDVFRNFVFPVSLAEPRFVRAVELNPGNRRVLHHARIKLDTTGQARDLDGRDPEPGFPGLVGPGEMPGGHFLTWQPGRVARWLPPGLGFRLEPGSDLVLETHLNPSGKPESFQPAIGLYFTDQAPTNECLKMALTTFLIDIPAGRTDYVVESSFKLPADIELLAVMPHAHYLARDVQAWADLPAGTRQPLVWIQRWNFNWQSDYRYVQPLLLPSGTTLRMRYTFDNSEANPRNPRQPPQTVRWGLDSRDEMAELWMQLLPRREADRLPLLEAYNARLGEAFREGDEYALSLNPNDVRAHLDLGRRLSEAGRFEAALEHLQVAIRLRPESDEPHYVLGTALRRQGKLDEARAAFTAALQLNPANAKAHGNLGFIDEEQGHLQEAEQHFREALRLNPYDTLVKSSLADLLRRK